MLAAGLLIFGSCNKDNRPNTGGSNPAPHIAAEIGTATKAGVIENNPDYAKGEKLRWITGAKALVEFHGDGGKESITYTVNTVEEKNPKKCTFDPESGATIDDGDYTLHGFYPKEGWNIESLSVTMPASQTQARDASSGHLGDYLFMKAQADVSVAEGEIIDMNYKHLTSLMRYIIVNNTGNDNFAVKTITLSTTTDEYFGKDAALSNNTATSLTTTSGVNAITLDVTNGEFSPDNTLTAFIALLPTTAAPDDMTVTLLLDDNGSDRIFSKTISGNALNILEEGFRQGHSYYLKLTLSSAGVALSIGVWEGASDDPIEGETNYKYKIGDYYPHPADPNSAIGVVFWVDPADRHHGKIVSLDEGRGQWNLTNRNSKTSATNLYNGLTNMNTIYISYPAYSDYPAFEWVHAKNGGGTTNYYTKTTTDIWYLPAREEFRALCAGYSGKVYEEIIDWDHNATVPGYNEDECVAARTAFNIKLTAAGGVGLRDAVYFSSSEYDQRNAWGVGIAGNSSSWDKTSSQPSIRAILAF